MGLAPYGEPKYLDLIYDHLLDLKGGGAFRLDMSYFNYATGLAMTNAKFDQLSHGHPMRQRQRALAGESFGMDAGEVGNFRGGQEIF